jgi:hypothetical protein
MEGLIREGVQIVTMGNSQHVAVDSASIRVDKTCISEVEGNSEISLALDKRFKGKRTLYVEPGFKDLVTWCLCTDSYKFSEKNVEKVSDKDIEMAWQFVDTMSVSSTRQCRELILKYKGARSSVGFRREHMRPPSLRPVTRGSVRASGPSRLERYTDMDSKGYSTLNDMIAEDCMHWVRTSSDPVSTALLLRSRITQGNERRDDLGEHGG